MANRQRNREKLAFQRSGRSRLAEDRRSWGSDSSCPRLSDKDDEGYVINPYFSLVLAPFGAAALAAPPAETDGLETEANTSQGREREIQALLTIRYKFLSALAMLANTASPVEQGIVGGWVVFWDGRATSELGTWEMETKAD